MRQHLKCGWKLTSKHPVLIILLFIYHWIWGFVIYKYVQSVVNPLLHRYPGDELGDMAKELFFLEGQFRLLKTDLIQSYLWTLGLILMLRMVLTPILNAGVYYSIYTSDQSMSRRFIKGVKYFARPYAMIYSIRILLTVLPLFWLIPKAIHMLKSAHSLNQFTVELLPWIMGYIILASILHLLAIAAQFHVISGAKSTDTLEYIWKHGWKMALISLSLLLLYVMASSLSVMLSMVQTGFLILIVHQLFSLIRVFFRIWEISSQHSLWQDKQTNITI